MIGEQAAQVAVQAAYAAVDCGDHAQGGAEHPGAEAFVEDDVGELEGGAGGALENPSGQQQRQAGGQCAQQGAQGGDRQNCEEHLLAAGEIAEPSEDHACDRTGEEEQRGDLGDVSYAAAEFARHFRQRRGDHARVELVGDDAQHQRRDENDPFRSLYLHALRVFCRVRPFESCTARVHATPHRHFELVDVRCYTSWSDMRLGCGTSS